MKIVQLIPGTGHFYCGSCLRDDALGRALRSLGHEVVVAPLYLPLVVEQAETEPAPEAVHMGGINMYLQQKLPLARFTPRFLENMLDRPGLLRWASRRGSMTEAADLGDMTLSMLRGEEGRQRKEIEKLVGWLASEARPDVLLLSNAMLLGMARRLKSVLDVPILCSLQGEAPFLDGLSDEHRSAAWSVLSERAADVEAFLAVSHFTGQLMCERLGIRPDRVHVVHNGIDTTELVPAEPGQREGPPVLGYLARMCPDKGLDTLVDAYVLVRKRGRIADLRLSVAGVLLKEDHGFLEEQRAKLRARGLAGEAEFTPNVERAEKLAFLRGLDVLSVPAAYGESFGLYVLEALASGVPVVQPRHGAFPEIMEATGGGILCKPNDPADLATGIERLLLDPELAHAMAERGRRSVLEKFTSERMARGVERVCKMIAARERSVPSSARSS